MWLSKIADLLAQWTKRKSEYSSSDGNCAFCEVKAFCETASFRVTVPSHVHCERYYLTIRYCLLFNTPCLPDASPRAPTRSNFST